jgi:hypothetical protein
MSTNLKPLQDCIKLLADVAVDSVAASKSGGSAAAIVGDFSNVLSDLIVLLPEIGSIPSVSSLGEADYAALVASLGVDLVLPGKPGAIVTASLKTLSDIVTIIVPDVQAIVSAAKA